MGGAGKGREGRGRERKGRIRGRDGKEGMPPPLQRQLLDPRRPWPKRRGASEVPMPFCSCHTVIRL